MAYQHVVGWMDVVPATVAFCEDENRSPWSIDGQTDHGMPFVSGTTGGFIFMPVRTRSIPRTVTQGNYQYLAPWATTRPRRT